MFAGFTTLRAAIYVAIVLVLSFVVTGTISSIYKRERESLGELHYERGQLLAQHSMVAAAVDEYREALLFLPDNARSRLSLATALMNIGHLDEAQAHLQQLQQADPTNSRINLALARTAVERKKLNEAVQYYQRAVYEYWPTKDIPERRAARWELVKLLETTGRRNEVVGELMQLYSSAPPDPQERAKIGFLLLNHGAVSEAAQIFRNLERSYPQQTDSHRGLAEANFAAGDYVSARHELQHALRTKPNDYEMKELLSLTNAVIDLDPVLPAITSAERLRRSENLLNRTISDLAQCWIQKPPSPDAQHQLDQARDLLQSKLGDNDDVSLDLQRTAQQLWQNRASFCLPNSPSNRAVELALARVSNE